MSLTTLRHMHAPVVTLKLLVIIDHPVIVYAWEGGSVLFQAAAGWQFFLLVVTLNTDDYCELFVHACNGNN